MQRKLPSRLVVAALLLGVVAGSTAQVAIGLTTVSSQADVPTSKLLPVVLPDLSRTHRAVQEQLGEAYSALTASGAHRSNAYGRLGTLLMAGTYLNEAEPCFQNAQLLAPDDFRWPYYLGHIFKNRGELAKAVEQFERVLRLQPDYLAALVWLGHVYIDMGHPEAAQAPLTRARSLHPDSQAARFQLGRAAAAQRNYASAVEHLDGALRMNSAATVIGHALAMAYRGLGNLEQAQHYLDQSRSRAGAGVGVALSDPLMSEVNTVLRSPQAYWDLGLYAGGRANWPEAVRQFQKAVELAPGSPVLRLNLALALKHLGDARTAMEQFQEAVRLNPQFAEAHFELGTLFDRSGRDLEAIDRYTMAVTYAPNLVKAHLWLADALRRTDQLEASLLSYQRVLELEPDWQEARFGEAMALVRLVRHGEAVDRLRVAMNLHPEESKFSLALARLLAASSDPQVRNSREAIDLVEGLVDQHEIVPMAIAEAMAMAFAEGGQFAQAVDWQRMAIARAIETGYTGVAQQMAANLSLYQRKQPCRAPWRDDEPEHRPGPTIEPGLLDASRRAE